VSLGPAPGGGRPDRRHDGQVTETYVVLLRGVNVGRAKRVAMADLRALLTELEGSGVRTLLNSGNAVLHVADTDPDALAAAVRDALARRLDLDVTCVVRTAPELRAVVAANPFPHVADGSRLMVHFLSTAPDPALLAAHDPVAVDPQRLRVGERVLYQWCPDGLLAAPDIGPAVARLGVTFTARNWNTVSKLAGILDTG
jgi:uncharacterized protein (DUF1697 family)